MIRIILVVLLLSVSSVYALPKWEENIIAQVAVEYRLSTKEVDLLKSIRKMENGRSGLYFGVAQEVIGHEAKRYKHAPYRSYLIQCRWAAGTIDKRYNGDLFSFSKRWCPRNWGRWYKSVSRMMSEYSGERLKTSICSNK